MSNILYPGRFQPFHVEHLKVALKILRENPGNILTILVADWLEGRTRENPFTGKEAAEIAKLTLSNFGLGNSINVATLALSKEIKLFDALGEFISRNEIASIYTGSENTISVLGDLQTEGMDFKVFPLKESPLVIHSTRIREMMMEGDTTWQEFMSPFAVKYFEDNPHLIERLITLPFEGEKRPWSTERR